MIYIDRNKNTQVVYIPDQGYEPVTDSVRLTAVSTADRTQVEFVVNECKRYSYLLRLIVGLPEGLTLGEWQYTLSDGSNPDLTGLMVVTANSDAVMQYKRDITYKQYGE